MALEGRRGRVARVQLIAPAQGDIRYQDGRELLRAALVPGTSVERYGRVWFMGQVQDDGEVLTGRIGFEADDGVTEVWDPDEKDFRVLEYPTGTTSPFAVRLSDLQMVFQTRGSVIRVNSFVRAMQGLIRAATNDSEWQVVTTYRQVSYAAWRASVARVTKVRFHLERPNPNYQDRPFVEQLLEGAEAVSSTVQLSNPDGIQADGEIVGQLLDHVSRGYGDGTIVGVRQTPQGVEESSYETRLNGESDQREVPADDRGDVPPEALRAELVAQPSEEPSQDD